MIRVKLVLLVLIMCSSFINEQHKETYSLTITVKELRNLKGHVQFTIYNKDKSIPDEKFEGYYLMKTGVIDNNSEARVTFKNLPKGKYAVNILHDENKDGKIDKGWVLPTEGVGFSNFESIGLRNRPKFSKASFELDKDKTVAVKIIYF